MATAPSVPPALDRWSAFWTREAKRHLPRDFELHGVMGGGLGTSFPSFLMIMGLVMVAVLATAWVLSRMAGWPTGAPVLIVAVAGMALPQLLAEIGVYRPVLLAWNSERLLVVERAGFDRLVAIRAYDRPIRGGLRWEGTGTLVVADERIFVHRPVVSRAFIAATFLEPAEGKSATRVSFEDITAQAPGNGIWHTLHVGGILVLAASIGIAALSAFGAFPWPATWPLPVASPSAVAADSSGRVAILLKSYSRIQVYDHDGRFQRGWSVGSHGRTARLAVDTTDRLWVYCERDQTMRRYTFDGIFTGLWLYVTRAAPRSIRLDQKGEPGIDRHAVWSDREGTIPIEVGMLLFEGTSPSGAFVDGAGSRYEIPGPWWLPRARRSAPASQALTIWGPFWILPIGFPSPGIPLGLLLAVGGYVGVHRRRRA
ncbi:MAG: hypothetical protein HYX75_01945 [Acidobacteria bacterium]|nr:hypothetical protein [Acidobacteriota bacterium]